MKDDQMNFTNFDVQQGQKNAQENMKDFLSEIEKGKSNNQHQTRKRVSHNKHDSSSN